MSTPNEDGCCSACWLPYEMCECQHWSKLCREDRMARDAASDSDWWQGYTNGDRMEDVEMGLVHGDGGERTYLNDNDGDERCDKTT